ncbi:MAG: MarR family winged helix-turn-helix transcriptional regulator, partial [Betaproteobacteria bacterium]
HRFQPAARRVRVALEDCGVIDAPPQLVYVDNYLSARPHPRAVSYLFTARVETPSNSVAGIKQLISYRLHVLANLSARWAEARYQSRFRLKLLEWRAMALLGGYAPQSLTEVARGAGLEKSYASRTVTGLIKRGLVTSAPDDRDGRGKRFALTRSGRTLYAKVFADAIARSDAWLAVLSEVETVALMDMLQRLTDQARALESADKLAQ